jgi:acrylyl-CoA reductase (NADPH)
MFTALIINKAEDGAISQIVQELDESRLPDGDVLVKVDYSTLNYKDGLCMHGQGGLVRAYPHVPGVDFAGVVESSSDSRYQPGDRVVSTGWRVGEALWGGYASKARLTSMLAVIALEKAGLKPEQGEVLVTGAAGGVGSVAVAILAQLGYRVAAVTGRPETADYLRELGAETIIARDELSGPNPKPLESERWAGAVDAVGGDMLVRVLKQMRYNGAVAAIGLAGGAAAPTFTVIPFLLRGVSLFGIDSVMRPHAFRVEAWERIVTDLPLDKLESMVSVHSLEEMPQLGKAILQGGVRGRVIVDPNM